MALEHTKWGILFCPKGSSANTRKYRSRLEDMLKTNNVEYDLVQSESESSVERLVKMFIDNSYKTIVIVGGDSALNDAVNCLMDCPSELRDTISLGVIPNGVLNDFSKFWGLKEGDVSFSIHTLLGHRVRKIDLGCMHYADKEGEGHKRYFINCINIGLIADMMNLRRQTRSLLGSRTLSFSSQPSSSSFTAWNTRCG